jgi:hypothetical protein
LCAGQTDLTAPDCPGSRSACGDPRGREGQDRNLRAQQELLGKASRCAGVVDEVDRVTAYVGVAIRFAQVCRPVDRILLRPAGGGGLVVAGAVVVEAAEEGRRRSG